MSLRGLQKQPLFLSIFISIVLCIAILVTILSTMFYVNVETVMYSQISGANLKSLNQISQEVNSTARMASTISYQIYNDVLVSKLLNFQHLNIYDQSLAMSQMTNYQTIFPTIDSIYLYNGTTDTFYVRSRDVNVGPILNKKSFFDVQAVTIIDKHLNYRPSIPIARRFIDSSGTLRNFYYTFVMYNNIWSGNNAVIVNINESSIQAILDAEQTAGSETFIMDDKGCIVSNSKNYPMLADMSDENYARYILDHEDAPGYFVAQVNGVKSLIVHTKPDSLGWTYVRVFQWDSLFRSIADIRVLIICFTLAIVVLGIVSAFIVSRQLYRPINRLIGNMSRLEAEKKGNTFQLRQEYLRGLLRGSVSGSRADMDGKLKEYGVPLTGDSKVLVVLLKIDHFREYQASRSYQEQAEVKALLAAVAIEAFANATAPEALDMTEDTVAVVLDAASLPQDDLRGTQLARLQALQAALLERCGLSVSAAVSAEGTGPQALHELYSQTVKAMVHRFFLGHGCVVFAEDVLALSATGYVYPTQKEELLTEALLEGRMEDVKRLYSEIVSETAFYSASVFNLTISHLIFSLNRTFHLIMANNSLSGSGVGIPITLLGEVETMEEFNANIFRILDRLSRSLDDRRNLKHESIVNSINEIIQARYSASDLSIGSVAEALGMSDAYICRIYKQYTSHTILDTIVRMRMQKARELLKNSGDPVTLIAEKCGFANSTYFYTAFKAANGVTPSDYRKNHQAENNQ